MSHSHGDHHYAMWDAAYILGSQSATDRREFEAHMGACPSCRNAAAELSGMPALLCHLDRDELAAIQPAQTIAPGRYFAEASTAIRRVAMRIAVRSGEAAASVLP